MLALIIRVWFAAHPLPVAHEVVLGQPGAELHVCIKHNRLVPMKECK